jgi:hypothetical protein
MKPNKTKDVLITIGVSVGVLVVVWGLLYSSYWLTVDTARAIIH